MDSLNTIPYLGSGLGFRKELMQETLKARASIDFLEIITEDFMGNNLNRDTLEEICDHFPVIPHGVGLSIGSADGVDEAYLRQIREVSELTKSPFYSEHLCQTRAPGINLGHLSPLWFTEEVLRTTIDGVHKVQDTLGKPLVLENVTYMFSIPHADMPQAEFFNRLVDATGCGVLLDVTNIFINSLNNEVDSITFMEAMPLDRVVQVHLAGGLWTGDVFSDTHTYPVQEESWVLLEELLKRTAIKGTLLERDGNYPDAFSDLTDQVARARALMDRYMHRLEGVVA